MPDLTRDALIEATTKTLIEQGASADSSIHSWRCEYPDRYGDCDCVDETSQTVVDAVLRFIADELEREADAADRKPAYDRMHTLLVAATYRDAAARLRSLLPSTEGGRP